MGHFVMACLPDLWPTASAQDRSGDTIGKHVLETGHCGPYTER